MGFLTLSLMERLAYADVEGDDDTQPSVHTLKGGTLLFFFLLWHFIYCVNGGVAPSLRNPLIVCVDLHRNGVL